MADVEATAAAPPTHAPPPTMRTALAVVLRGLLVLASRATLCGFLGALWVSNAANIGMVLARRFVGDGLLAADMWNIFLFSCLAMLLGPAALLVLSLRLGGGPQAEARQTSWQSAGGGGATVQRRPAESTGARLRPDCGYGPPTVLVYVLWSMIMLMGLAILLDAPEKAVGATFRAGLRFCDYGRVGCSAMVCFIFIPKLISQLRALPW